MVKCYTKERRRYFKEVFFSASSDFQEWTVPEGITSVHATVVGAKGRNGKSVGGAGGKVECDLEVTPGNTLYVYAGLMNTTGTATYTASDIRTNNTGITDTTSLNSRIIVAGAGGNGSDGDRNYFYQGGAGGGLTGGAGANARNAAGGGGGTQSSGGSSYTDSILCTNVVHTQGANPDGDGYVKIKYESDETDYTEFVTEGVAYQGIYNPSTLVYYKDYIFEANGSTPSFQEWVVPQNIRSVHVVACGAKGKDTNGLVGGAGGKVECDLKVTPGQTLYVICGSVPDNQSSPMYNAADIRTNNSGLLDTASLNSRLVVAGGGGNATAGTYISINGGAGGGLIANDGPSTWWKSGLGGAGVDNVSTGGNQSSSGTGANVWATGYVRTDNRINGTGSFGLGGSGESSNEQQAGAGGAGWYGGGGGASASFHDDETSSTGVCGGAGGSSYTNSVLCSSVVHTKGTNENGAYVVITTPGTPEDYTRVIDLGYECKLWKSSTGTYNTIHVNPTNERYTLTITPTPANAIVTLTCEGETQQGNSITTQARKMVRYEVSKEGYETKTGSVYIDSNQTLLVSLKQYCTLTLNTIPNNADVIFTVDGISYSGSNTITVLEGTEVTYTVSKTGYTTVNGSTTVNSTKSIAVSLEPVYVTLTINPTPNNATVVLTAAGYTQSGNTITVLEGTEVTYSVSKTGYTTQSGVEVVYNTRTLNIEISPSVPSGSVIFESSTAGTYTVNIPTTGNYIVRLVGGGSGSSRYNGNEIGSTAYVPYSVGGGSGAYISGTVNISEGNYTIVVGEGGLGNVSGNTGRAGGNTTFLGNTAGGGKAHSVNTVGGGGEYSIVSQGLTGTNGNAGSKIRGTKANCGGASLYNGYGAGGSTLSGNGEYGIAGYVSIVKA